MKRITAEDVFKVKDINESDFDVKEWKATLRIRGLSALEHKNALNGARGKNGELDATLLSCLVIYYGCIEPKFEKAHIELLAEKNVGVIDRISTEIIKLSGLSAGVEEDVSKN